MLNSMATNDCEPTSPLNPAPINGIQPGGGIGPWLARRFGSPEAIWQRNVLDPDGGGTGRGTLFVMT